MNSQATEALSNTLTNTYQPVSFGGNIPGNIAGVVGLNEGINESDAKQLETPGGVVNNFFPITKVEDELDARKLSRLVAAELARMPSR